MVVVVMVTAFVIVAGVIKSNLLIFMLGGGICIVGNGSGVN